MDGTVLGQGYVSAIAYAPDGEQVAIARPTMVEVWDANLRHLIKTVPHTGGALAWSPDSSKLAIQDYWTTIWDMRGPSKITQWVVDRHTESLSWAPSGDRLLEATRWGGEIRGLDGKAQFTIPNPRMFDVAWSGTGNYAAVLVDSGAEIWSTDSRTLQRTITVSGGISEVFQKRWAGLAWSPREPLLATCNSRHTVQTWDARTGDLLTTMEAGGNMHSKVAWSSDGERVALATDQFVIVWEARSGKRLREVRPSFRAILAAFSPSLDRAIVANGAGDFEIWDLASGKRERVPSHNAEFEYMAWSPQGTTLASWGGSGVIQIWDAVSGLLRSQFQAAVWDDRSVVWAADGSWLATAADDGSISLHDPLSGNVIRTLNGARPPVFAMSQSPEKTRLAALGGGSLWVWDLVQTGPPRQLAVAGRQFAWSSADTVLLATMEDSLVEVSVTTGKHTWSATPEHTEPRWDSLLWLSVDGRAYVAGSMHELWMRDAPGGPGRKSELWAGNNAMVSCTPDPRYGCGLFRSLQGHLTLYDLRSGEQRQIPLPWVSSSAAAISADFRTIALGFRGVITIVDMPTGRR
jgi:WD40 repeat protein